MKRIKKKYLDFYYRSIKNGRIPGWGLCESFRGDIYFNLIDPEDGKNNSYWGYGDGVLEADYLDVRVTFTPLRQNVVLLMAAMAGEL